MNPFHFITSLFGPATKLIDEIFTSKDESAKNQHELVKLKNELAKIQNELSSRIVDYESQLVDAKRKIIFGEISGNWLQRSWRPIMMLAFGFIVVYQYFIAHVFTALSPIEFMPDRFWGLLELGIGGYVAGRSLEKMVPQITKSVATARERARMEKAIPSGQEPTVLSESAEQMHTAKELKRMARKMRGEERRRKREARRNGVFS